MRQIGDGRSKAFFSLDSDNPLDEDFIASPTALVSALVVDRSSDSARPIVSALAGWHFHVTVADTFARANARLMERPPALLITQVRLAEYNGLHLVLHGKERCPGMAAVVLSGNADRVLQADAEMMGATFVVTPVEPNELMAAALRTLLRGSERTDEPIRAPFERRRRDSVVGPFPVATDPTRIPRRRDPDELMATISAFSAQESKL